MDANNNPRSAFASQYGASTLQFQQLRAGAVPKPTLLGVGLRLWRLFDSGWSPDGGLPSAFLSAHQQVWSLPLFCVDRSEIDTVGDPGQVFSAEVLDFCKAAGQEPHFIHPYELDRLSRDPDTVNFLKTHAQLIRRGPIIATPSASNRHPKLSSALSSKIGKFSENFYPGSAIVE